MANDIIIPKNFGPISSVFTPDMLGEPDEFSAGISGGFGVLGFRGKVWRTKYRGEEAPHLNDDGTPKGAVDVVIIKSNPHLSKVYYAGGYQEGSTEAPTCASSNGSVPDLGVAQPQCKTCAACPHNQWGSRITEAGKKGKACSDSKRAVIVPLDDMANEVYGGPMLMRIPAASLQDLAAYSKKMQGLGYRLFTIGTRMRFDVDAAYPKLVFSPIRPLNDEEAAYVSELRDDPRVEHILASVDEITEEASSEDVFEEPAAKATPVTTPAARTAPAPVQKATPAPRPPARPAPKAGGIAAAVAAPQPAPRREPPVHVVPAEEPCEEGPVPDSFEDALNAQLEDLL